jgi:phosphoribosylanthranilate isomerase
MRRVKVKICGLTRAADVKAVALAAADFAGFVFAESPRQLSTGLAAELVGLVPGGIGRVGLFMNQPASRVQHVLERVSLDLLQFHGAENDAYCGQFGLPFIKAIAMGGAGLKENPSERYPGAQGLLYDGHAPGQAGGSGRRFDWTRLPSASQQTWLAGGLTVQNVATAVRQARPWAVDVSSGVENGPGIKNPELISAFVQAARSVVIE